MKTTIRLDKTEKTEFNLVADEQGNLIDNVYAHQLGRSEDYALIFAGQGAEFTSEQARTITVNGQEFEIETLIITN